METCTTGTHRMPQRASRRNRIRLNRRPAPIPRGRRTREAHKPLHQHPRRIGHGRPRHLRHHDIHILARHHNLRWPSREHGLFTALRRSSEKAILPTPQQYHGSPTEWRLFWTGERYCYSC